MRAMWGFKAVRAGMQRASIRRTCGADTITGTEHDALEFARRAAEHLQAKDVKYVEAWSIGRIESTVFELPEIVTFRMKPHPNGKDWLAEGSRFMHPGWFQKFR